MNHVIVTGAGSGIARSLLQRLEYQGVRVTAMDVLDLTDEAAVASAVAEANAVAPVDGLATCAVEADRMTVLETTAGQFARTLTVNVVGALTIARAFARLLVSEARPGSIVMRSSTAALGHVSGLGAADHASHSAVVALTRSLAGDLATHGIRVNCVVTFPPALMAIDSQDAAISDADPLRSDAEAAAAMEWLLSAASSFTTGHAIPVDGGRSAISVPPVAGYPAAVIGAREGRAL